MAVHKRTYAVDFILDSDDDVSDLPEAQPGSTAIVADSTGHVYMMAPGGTWQPFGWTPDAPAADAET